MQGIKEKLGFHATALSLRSRRNEILASNIANAATPNFKARDLDFKNLKPNLLKGMAYGMLAGVEPVVGIYTGIFMC